MEMHGLGEVNKPALPTNRMVSSPRSSLPRKGESLYAFLVEQKCLTKKNRKHSGSGAKCDSPRGCRGGCLIGAVIVRGQSSIAR